MRGGNDNSNKNPSKERLEKRGDHRRNRENSKDRGRRDNRNAFGWSKRRVPISRSGRAIKGRGVFVSIYL